MAKQSFSQQKKEEMYGYVIKAITDLLEVMKSPIVYPKDRYGFVMENKLLSVVKAREDVYTSMISLIDLIEIESEKFRKEIISGLKTTWQELTNITTRDIGSIDENNEGEIDETDKLIGRESVEDNYLSNISKAKLLSAKIAYQILDRIEEIENPEILAQHKINQSNTGTIAELYAEN